MKKIVILPLLIMLFSMTQTYGQQLVYQPKNPAFGGDTFNYQWLLSSATAQNKFESSGFNFDDLSDVEQFTSDLNRTLLNQISRSLLGDQFADGQLQPGTFNFGSLAIEIFESSEGLVINILDTNTGEQTQVILPN